MKFIYVSLLLYVTAFASSQHLFLREQVSKIVPMKPHTNKKKARFFHLLVPAVQKVHKELMTQYKNIELDINNAKNIQKIKALKITYHVKTNKELLLALKPHQKSIVLAQAALESSWGTSRFFVQANNIFGVRSINKKEPRIVAGRNKNVWLKKFNNLEESVRDYYKFIAIGKAFKEFRKVRMETYDVKKIIKKLDKYSEIGSEYPRRLNQVIQSNKLIRYDQQH